MKIKDVEKLIEDCADYYPREVDFVPYIEIERRAKGHEINSIQAAYELGRNEGINIMKNTLNRNLQRHRQAERKKRVKAALNILKQDTTVDIDGLFKL